MAFIRAIQTGSLSRADHFRKVYPRLKRVDIHRNPLAASSFREVQDHALELGQLSVKERIDELKAVRKDLPDHVYSQRKANIVSSLQALLPGKTDRLKAMWDSETQHI